MKAVILAAGTGRRMLPLTKNVPKPLLRINNKTILDYIVDALPEEVDELVVVIGHLKQKIKAHLGVRYRGRSVRFIDQRVLDGPANALLLCKELFKPKERFIMIYGDEVPTEHEISECLAQQYSWLCSPTAKPHLSGIATLDDSGRIIEVIEKHSNPPSNLAAGGIVVMDSGVFLGTPQRHGDGEYYLASLMGQFLIDHAVYAVRGRADRPMFISPDELEKIDPVKLAIISNADETL